MSTKEKLYKVRVSPVPQKGLKGHFRCGKFWPNGQTDEKVTGAEYVRLSDDPMLSVVLFPEDERGMPGKSWGSQPKPVDASMVKVKSKGDFACDACGLEAKTKQGLAAHVMVEHGESDAEDDAGDDGDDTGDDVKCSDCERTFPNQQAMKTHRTRTHKSES